MTSPVIIYGASGGSYARGELPLAQAATGDRRWRIEGTGLAPVAVQNRGAITPTAVILRNGTTSAARFLLVATVAVVARGDGSYVTRNAAGATVVSDPPVRPALLASYAPPEFMELAAARDLGGSISDDLTTAQAVAAFLTLVADTWEWVEL